MRILLKNLAKTFGKIKAVDNISLELKDKEFVTLLGPSGCGKTTTLRCMAGLEEPDEGEIYFDDRLVYSKEQKVNVQVEKRKLGMVFQSYAVWPHMTVYDNVAYPLKIKRFSKMDIRTRVLEILKLIGLDGYEARYPHQLSGGEQQRVSLGRAIIAEPNALLFDEPLSNLDLKLRARMRFEISALQKRLGITSIYVTHDQTEAMVISDKICLMDHGRILQVGTPREIYADPRSEFAASFIGSTNLLRGKVAGISSEKQLATIETGKIESVLESGNFPVLQVGEEVAISIRPEDIKVVTKKPSEKTNVLEGRVYSLVFMGEFTECQISIGDYLMRTKLDKNELLCSGERVYVYVSPRDCVVIRL